MANPKLIFLAFLTILLVGCSASQPSLPQDNQAAEPTEDAAPAVTADSTPDPVQEKETAVEGQAQAAETLHVSIKSFKFLPADINVNIGDTVVWTNEDSAAHTVESNDGTLESDELSKGDTYKFTFTKAGKSSYICGIHPSMKGSVTVQ